MPHKKKLLIRGDRLLMALDVLSVIFTAGKKPKDHGFTEEKVRAFLQDLLGNLAVCLNDYMVYEHFRTVRHLLRHANTDLASMEFDILPLLLQLHPTEYDDRLQENLFHKAEIKFFEAFVSPELTEDDFRD